MVTLSPKNPPNIFICKICDYSCKSKKDFNKHKSTAKHKNGNNGNYFFCDTCNRKYKYRSGLSRHKKSCNKQPKKDDKVTSQMILKMIEQQNMIQDQIKKICTTNQQITYNKMTINVFLNEKCKDAMNLTDFLENVKVSLKDLEYTNEHGYAEGISNIFKKHLTDMKPTERPIHCSDSKRLHFYIKDQNRWEKDKAHNKIDRSIQDITLKQIEQLKEWERENPNYTTDQTKMYEWYNMVREIMGGSEDDDREKNREQIKKLIGANVIIKDAMKD